MSLVTLDHIDGIEVHNDHPALQGNHALEYLPHGLRALAATVRAQENIMLQSGNAPDCLITFNPTEYALEACYFNWFSVSAINYCRLIALIDFMNKHNLEIRDINANKDDVKKFCTDYSKKVIPEVHKWRNKIAAHFAITDPYKDDGIGTLEASILIPVSYNKPYFVASEWQSGMTPPSDIPKWKLTEEYEKLAIRFWPDRPIPPLVNNVQPYDKWKLNNKLHPIG
jgi:hypothetical protein